MLKPCYDCQTLPCSATVELKRRSRSASAEKCGYLHSDNKWYLVQTWVEETSSEDGVGDCHGICPSKSLGSSSSKSATTVKTWDKDTCVITWSGSGTSSSSSSDRSCHRLDSGAYAWESSSNLTSTWTISGTGETGTVTTTNSGSSTYTQHVDNSRSPNGSASTCYPVSPPFSVTTPVDTTPVVSTISGGEGTMTPTVEYTDEDLESKASAALSDAAWGAEMTSTLSPGSYLNEQYRPAGTTASGPGVTLASRTNTSSSRSLTASRYRIRLTIERAAFCKLNASWSLEFVPTGGGPASKMNGGSLTWSRPECFPADGPFTLESQEFDVLPPEGSGVIRITGLKIDCL